MTIGADSPSLVRNNTVRGKLGLGASHFGVRTVLNLPEEKETRHVDGASRAPLN
jgi:hypothetical protein